MFTVSLANQADILQDLLELYYPQGASIIDFTYGTGAIYWNIFEKPGLSDNYRIMKCDAEPSLENEAIMKLDLTTDDYSNLGAFDIGVFDPPYLKRPSFDYPNKSKVLSSNIANTQVIAMQYQGKRSWAAKKLNRFVANLTPEIFTERLKGLARVAPTVIKEEGLLLVKIMNPREKGAIWDHAFEIKTVLNDKWKLVDELAYIRQGPTTWKIKGHLQSLHGYWLTFQKRPRKLE